MATDNHYHTPEPTGGPTYSDPLLDWIGTPVRAEWAGKEVEGVVTDVDLDHAGHSFRGQLKVRRRDSGIVFSVSTDDVTRL